MVTIEVEEKYYKDIVNVLKPIQVAVETLSCQNVSLLAADSILNFLLKKLENQKTKYGDELLSILKRKLTDHRSISLLSAFKYLHDPVNQNLLRKPNCTWVEFFYTHLKRSSNLQCRG